MTTPPQPPPPEQQPVAQIQPQPTPFQPIIQRGTLPNGQEVVVLQLIMVTGSVVLFMPPDGAAAFAADLATQARGAASGLLLPPGLRL